MFTTCYLFNPLTVPAAHLLSPFLAQQPSLHLKSQTADLDMHHLVFGINLNQIHFVSITSPVSIHLIHLLIYLCRLHHSHHPSLFHCMLKTYLINKSFPP